MNRDIVLEDVSSGEKHCIILPCVLGRGKEADLSFPDKTISHRHAMITGTDDQNIWIQDLKSSNGIRVNDIRIKDKTALKEGDTIQLGQSKFQISGAGDDITPQTIILHSLSLTEEKDLDHHRLKAIYEIAGEVTADHEISHLGKHIFSKLKKIFNHDRGYIASFEEGGSLTPLYLSSLDEALPLSKSIINRLLKSGESFILEDALSDTVLREQKSVMALNIRSAICVPLIYNQQIYGLIYMDRNVPGAFQQEDLDFLRSLGSILAPLIENARLWSELQKRYDNAVDTLKETEARLIETERTAAYVRLALAMAHEIRNPVMFIGGMLRRLEKKAADDTGAEKIRDILLSVEQVESVLQEVDSFVKIPPPQKSLHRIDELVQEEIDRHSKEWQTKSIHPALTVNTPHLFIPLDAGLVKKVISMIIKEIIFTLTYNDTLNISIQECGNNIHISFGESDTGRCLCEPFDKKLKGKPWSSCLFLNIAHKILIDHGGKLLMDPEARSAFPIVMTIPRTDKV